ncbi:MAG TPA: hypothetical protein VM580_32240 [Labilithrix sp.]|nr:hypothetical protein [Labilithrix sp.]
MADSRRGEGEQAERQLKVDIPPELKQQLKRESVDLDIPMKRYVQRILERRLPWDVMEKVDARARGVNLDSTEYLLKLLREAGVLDT